MKLEGSLYKEQRLLAREAQPIRELGPTFTHDLDRSLLELCKTLSIPLPVWMKKNTREFAAWRQTDFTLEQFCERVRFDRLHIRLVE